MTVFVGQHLKLEIGKGKYSLDRSMVEAERCSIKGQRGRDIRLIRLTPSDFHDYAPDLRGIPSCFCWDNGTLLLYPAPDRDMELLVEGTPSGTRKIKEIIPPDAGVDRRSKEWKEYVRAMDAKDLENK